ncbi:kinesin light chain [Truncatella angustata]|uniref:Kinesin light chain n=1 Tax=Truncatella angustata TaxID=152316 RepID=A0A9P8ZX60_9PEZI|nr:kinesin light chain [Truncatella angustata]KAH6653642.1 kinesin light chain [Truncatella angustata]
MRLLQRDDTGKYSLTPDLPAGDVPPYAILSHTWGANEVVFGDLARPEDEWQHKHGYEKIEFCTKQARQDGIQYFWVDTCCIDKSDSIELQTAINSMFRWYRDAKRCYVYLADVSRTVVSGPRQSTTPWEADFRNSRWFTRGWTLQELIAPKTVDFYSKEGSWLGDKRSLELQICDVTNIPVKTLRGAPLSDFTVSEREAWAGNRQTKYEEDMAYSLLGIFDVYMPLIYGEGRENARKRLREEVQKATQGTQREGFSITLSLSDVPEIQYFVAREGELAEMRRTLSSDGSRRIVTLHGLGGIGKTQLAVAYTKRYRNEYSAIFWFNIKDETSLQQSFSRVARQILQQHPDASHLSGLDPQQNAEEVFEAVKAWLSLPGNNRWLLVYDNYDNPKSADRTDHGGIDIKRFLPTAHQGSIIITSRSSQINIGHSIRTKKLESMNDGLEILSTTSGRANLQDDTDARKLVKELDGLPLALATAGAYLRRVAIGLDDYLRIYKESWARLHVSTPSLGSYQDRTLCSTWQLSYEQVQKQNSLAAYLLRWWAYFDNEDIWFQLLQPNGIDDREAWTHELTDELKFNSAMGTLHDYGFVELHIITPDLVGSRGYSIHSCVHAWTIHIVNKDRDDEAQFWLLQRRLLSHAIRSCATIQDSDQDLACAFYNLGYLYAYQGKLIEAEDMYLRALRGNEKAWGPDHTSTLSTLVEAEDMYLRALRGNEKAWGPDHTSTLSTVHNLAGLYADQGKLVEAEDMYLRALRGKEKAWGPDHTSTLDTVNNLGILYKDQGKLVEAEDMYLRALRGCEKAQAGRGRGHVSAGASREGEGVGTGSHVNALHGQ